MVAIFSSSCFFSYLLFFYSVLQCTVYSAMYPHTTHHIWQATSQPKQCVAYTLFALEGCGFFYSRVSPGSAPDPRDANVQCLRWSEPHTRALIPVAAPPTFLVATHCCSLHTREVQKGQLYQHSSVSVLLALALSSLFLVQP